MNPRSTSIDAELASRLRLVVGRLARRLRLDGDGGLPPLQLSTLVTIELHGPIRLGELAQRESVAAPTMSRVLAALDERRAIERRPDPVDARSTLVTVSATGRDLLAVIRSERTASLARRMDRLDPAQRAALAAALPALETLVADDLEH
ncbi:MAG TPA: MarR family transcriptional regulator [Mycobacteriales bacterium]